METTTHKISSFFSRKKKSKRYDFFDGTKDTQKGKKKNVKTPPHPKKKIPLDTIKDKMHIIVRPKKKESSSSKKKYYEWGRKKRRERGVLQKECLAFCVFVWPLLLKRTSKSERPTHNKNDDDDEHRRGRGGRSSLYFFFSLSPPLSRSTKRRRR